MRLERRLEAAMARVKVLPEDVAKRIAAGEVIERPASCVKELVENSLDAGATRVTVELSDGGTRLIRVVDDGCGMTRDDAVTSLLRHATSKISSVEDLDSIRTLGFRGEALPSIAAVSRFVLVTRPADELAGTRLTVEGGAPLVEEIGCPPGTSVLARDIFYSLPARRKFLRSATTEAGRISDIVTALALATPRVGFKLAHNGRTVIDCPPAACLEERVTCLFGREVADKLLPVEAEEDGIRVWGLVSRVDFTRATRSMQRVFVNGRPVQDRVVSHAVFSAYENRIPPRRHPVAAIFVELDPAAVDVNIHPCKMEIRFKDERAAHSAVRHAVLAALSTPEARPQVPGESLTALAFEAPLIPHVGSFLADEQAPLTPPRPALARTSVLGQVDDTYIVARDAKGLIIVDQHALHERILFDEIKASAHAGKVEVQPLLIPAQLEVPAERIPLLTGALSELAVLGLEVEDFGGNSFIIRSVPACAGDVEPQALLNEILDRLEGAGAASAELPNLAAEGLACAAAVKAGQPLSFEEMDALLAGLTDELIASCPHGRPAVLRLSSDELARRFGRK